MSLAWCAATALVMAHDFHARTIPPWTFLLGALAMIAGAIVLTVMDLRDLRKMHDFPSEIDVGVGLIVTRHEACDGYRAEPRAIVVRGGDPGRARELVRHALRRDTIACAVLAVAVLAYFFEIEPFTTLAQMLLGPKLRT